MRYTGPDHGTHWFEPGSTRVDSGFTQWTEIPDTDGERHRASRIHHLMVCDARTEDPVSVDVFHHPDLGLYVFHPRTGERFERIEWCSRCAPEMRAKRMVAA